MNSTIFQAIIAITASSIFTFVVLNLLIKYSLKLKLVDVPNERKLHKEPIPSIGGLVIVIALIFTVLTLPILQNLVYNYFEFFICLVTLCVLGVLDDRLDVSALLRFTIELLCAFLVAYKGIRLTSLHGILGITELPIIMQYGLTIFIIVGVTNAFNLIDGIDGLAGSLAVVNLSVLAYIAYTVNETGWLVFLIALVSSILVFLKYNWQPAKLFMGDGGSLVIGFFTASLGLFFINKVSIVNSTKSPQVIVALIAAFIIPVMDTIRLFYTRIRMGKSPFSADKNHLHHWLIKNHILHKQATLKIALFHIFLMAFSFIAIQFLSITTILLMLIAFVVVYTKLLQLNNHFQRWYKFIKRMEVAN